VITNKQGAKIEGLKNGMNCIIANSEQEIAARIIELIDNDYKRSTIGKAAKKLINKLYSIESIKNDVKNAYTTNQNTFCTTESENKYAMYFSIITPILSANNHTKEFVKTLQEQVFRDWECLIIDDGCHDTSIENLKAATKNDTRFIYITRTSEKEIKSPYLARNIGIEHARGKYICFLDIDDKWEPEKLLTQYMLIQKKTNIKLIFSSYIRTESTKKNGKVRNSSPFIHAKHTIKFANPIPMLTSCVSREAIGEIRFKPINHEDYIFWHEVIKSLKKEEIIQIKKPLAIYKLNKKSLSGNKVLAASWIWKCYKIMGYNPVKRILLIILRGMFQGFLTSKEFIMSKISKFSNIISCNDSQN